MKSEEQIKRELAILFKKQAERLEKGEMAIIEYKIDRQRIHVLEDILELNVVSR